MERLMHKNNKYLMFGLPVKVTLIYGPVIYSYDYNEEDSLPIDDLIKQIREKEGISLIKISNSYITTGINIIKPHKKTRHEFVWFFRALPQLN